jgi:hypothetical protein
MRVISISEAGTGICVVQDLKAALQGVDDADTVVLEDKAGKRFNVAELELALDDAGDTIVVLRAGEAATQ